MSLEDAVIANTAAVLKLTEALLKGGAKPSAADAAIEKEAGRVAASTKKADTKGTPAKITIDTVTEAYAAYLDTPDKAERKRRGGFLKQISGHFGVERISALETEAQFKEALGYLKRLQAGDEDLFPAEDDDEDVSI